MDQFKDAHYFHIPCQGNIYTTTKLKLTNGKVLILAASLKRDIFYFEYLESPQGLVPTTKEISFTYIPSGAEIISMDAFSKSTANSEAVIGITIIKNSNDSDTLETFLNIYSQLEEREDFKIENIAQNCLTIELNFIPYKLMHTELVSWSGDKMVNKELVFVLSGSDNMVHIYRENMIEHVYKEIDYREFFPEFGKTPSPIIWIDICYMSNYEERITTFCCECGYVKFLKVNTKTKKVVYNFSTKFTNYVSNVHLYFETGPKLCERTGPAISKVESLVKREGRQILNLLVVNSVLPPVLFRDVLKYGLSDYVCLPRHNLASIFTSCIIDDIDFDGRKEILIGASSEELLLYKFDIRENKWYLEEIRQVPAPVLALQYVDVSGDGVRELIVASMKGIHILQNDLDLVQKKLTERIDALTIPRISVS